MLSRSRKKSLLSGPDKGAVHNQHFHGVVFNARAVYEAGGATSSLYAIAMFTGAIVLVIFVSGNFAAVSRLKTAPNQGCRQRCRLFWPKLLPLRHIEGQATR